MHTYIHMNLLSVVLDVVQVLNAKLTDGDAPLILYNMD